MKVDKKNIIKILKKNSKIIESGIYCKSMFIHKFWYLLDHHLSFKLFLKLLNLLINTVNALSLILFGVYLSNKKILKKNDSREK